MVSASLGKLPLQCLPSTKFTKSLILFRKALTELSISSEMVVAAPEIKKAIRTPNGCGSGEWGWGMGVGTPSSVLSSSQAAV